MDSGGGARPGLSQAAGRTSRRRRRPDITTAFQEAAKAIYDGWNGFWEDLLTGNLRAFSDFGERIEQFFLKLLAQLAAALWPSRSCCRSSNYWAARSGWGKRKLPRSPTICSARDRWWREPVERATLAVSARCCQRVRAVRRGGIGSLVGGAIGGLGSLLGGTFGARLSVGGSLMSGMGLLSGGASALGVATNGMVGAGVSARLIASTVIPVVGAVVAALVASGVFKKEPHPSSFAIAGSYPEGHGNLTGYHGKGDWITSGVGAGIRYATATPTRKRRKNCATA